MATCVGPPFWDSLLGAGNDGQYPEYVSPDIFLGEYVAKLEQDHSSDALTKSDSPEESPPTQKVPRWKRRTPEQIEANKAAQKRFRQRKKAKLQTVSQNVEDLTQQMQDMEGLKAGVKSMEDRKAALEGDLWAKEAEIEQIKFEMLNPRTPQAVYDDKTQGKCLFTTPPTLDKKVDKVELRWKQAKEKLDQVLSGGDLQPRSKPELSSKQTGGLEKASLAVIAQCMEVLSLGGAQLNDLLRTLADRQEDLMRQGEMAKYAELAEFLCLSPQQTQDVLALRTSVMQRLERVYTIRQGLNNEIMVQLMDAPQAPEEGSAPASAAERAGKLREKLDLLLGNLREEQRLESEHHWAIMRKILTPLQGAWFISKAYPTHCDTLAFMHGVYHLQSHPAAANP